jgi:hypothetical protein
VPAAMPLMLAARYWMGAGRLMIKYVANLFNQAKTILDLGTIRKNL